MFIKNRKLSFMEEAVEVNPMSLVYLESKFFDEDLLVRAVKENPECFDYIKNPTKKIMEAYNQSINLIDLINNVATIVLPKNRNEKLINSFDDDSDIVIACNKGLFDPKAVNVVSEYLLPFVLKEVPSSLQYLKNKKEYLDLIATWDNPENLEFVKNQTPFICYEILKRYPKSIEFIKEQNYKYCTFAIDNWFEALGSIKNPSIEVANYALEKSHEVFKYIDNNIFPEKTLLEEIRKYPPCFGLFKTQTHTTLREYFLVISNAWGKEDRDSQYYVKHFLRETKINIQLTDSLLEGIHPKIIKILKKKYKIVKESKLSKFI